MINQTIHDIQEVRAEDLTTTATTDGRAPLILWVLTMTCGEDRSNVTLCFAPGDEPAIDRLMLAVADLKRLAVAWEEVRGC